MYRVHSSTCATSIIIILIDYYFCSRAYKSTERYIIYQWYYTIVLFSDDGVFLHFSKNYLLRTKILIPPAVLVLVLVMHIWHNKDAKRTQKRKESDSHRWTPMMPETPWFSPKQFFLCDLWFSRLDVAKCCCCGVEVWGCIQAAGTDCFVPVRVCWTGWYLCWSATALKPKFWSCFPYVQRNYKKCKLLDPEILKNAVHKWSSCTDQWLSSVPFLWAVDCKHHVGPLSCDRMGFFYGALRNRRSRGSCRCYSGGMRKEPKKYWLGPSSVPKCIVW